MKKVIAITGKKGSGKTTLALFLKVVIARYKGLIDGDLLNNTIDHLNINQYENDPYNIWINDKLIDINAIKQISICSFAYSLKKLSTDVLSMESEIVNGSQKDKEKNTIYLWNNMPIWIRWINSSDKYICDLNGNKIDIDASSISRESDLWKLCARFNAIPAGLRDGFMSHREVLQILGTDIFRYMFDKNVWVNSVKNFINNSDSDYFIIDDMRFESELNSIKNSFNYIVINLNRITPYKDSHSSEAGLSEILLNGDYNSRLILSEKMCDKNMIACEFLRDFVYEHR